ncbi:ABC transporter permease, partial [Rhodobacteraceae bacterium]|nr:ABC transporter permease [Paracoccaceae bacterium]
MDPLTWTGSLAFLNPIFLFAWVALGIAVVVQIITTFMATEADMRGQVSVAIQGPVEYATLGVKMIFAFIVLLFLAYVIGGILMPSLEAKGIIGTISTRLLPVWIALAVTFALSIAYKRRLGLYGKMFDSIVGMIGYAIVMFWVFVAIFGALDLIVTHDPLAQVSGMKNKVPGTALPNPDGDFGFYLLGGDNLARDVYSRVIKGAWEVVKIAPFATLFAFMVGITLGLPAAYYGGKLDTILSFIANLVLAFPVILLFYLLVTPEIVATGIPIYMAAVLFIFPLIFITILINSRFFVQPKKRNIYLGISLAIGIWIYLGIAWNADPFGIIDFPPNLLVVFVSVVFVNS